MKKAGNAPVIKFYAGAGHFIHTDVPDEYSQDVVRIVLRDSISGPVEDVSGYVSPGVKAPEDIQAYLLGTFSLVCDTNYETADPAYGHSVRLQNLPRRRRSLAV